MIEIETAEQEIQPGYQPSYIKSGIDWARQKLKKQEPPPSFNDSESFKFTSSSPEDDAFVASPQRLYYDKELINIDPSTQTHEYKADEFQDQIELDESSGSKWDVLKNLSSRNKRGPIIITDDNLYEEKLEQSEEIENFRYIFTRLKNEIGKYMVGHEHVTEATLLAIFAEGHVILEGMPGIGKTQLVNTISEAMNLISRRVSFAPDLMPQDITGSNILIENQTTGRREFEFVPGPVFTNLLLADEINRGHPRVHSALLEAMQERKVTYANIPHMLPRPFFVLSTMNPLEQDATYSLPEAQQDRFLFKLLVDYTSPEEDKEILKRTTGAEVPTIENVCSGEDVMWMSNLARQVPIPDLVLDYAVNIVHSTRPNGTYVNSPDITNNYVTVGASPRAEQAMVLAGKVRALANNRLNVSLEDISTVAPDVLRHRLIFAFGLEKNDQELIINEIIGSIDPYKPLQYK